MADFAPGAGADDGQATGTGGYGNALEYARLGNVGGTSYTGWICFRSVNIPQGSTINSAVVKLTSWTNRSNGAVNLLLSAHDVDDGEPVYSDADFSTKYAQKTAAGVAWNNVGAWSYGVQYSSPDITSVIQEIVNRPGWVAGNDILIFIANNGSSTSAYRQARMIELTAPVLSVTWTEPSTAPKLKRWNGTAWVKSKLKAYFGGSWVEKPLKVWTGTEWKTVDTSGS